MLPEQAYAVIFAPHPDDAEGSIGGTITRWTREGKRVILVICTNGEKGTNDPNIKPETLVQTREIEERAAAQAMGVQEIIFLRHPDQTLTDEPIFREEITRLIRQYRPEVVATTDPMRRGWSHPDHRNTGQVVLDAISLYARNLYSFPDLFFKEGLELHRVQEALLWGADNPNCCFDITDTFDTKMTAIECHISQFGGPSPDRATRMRERHKELAAKEGFEVGEAFYRMEMRMPPRPPPKN